MNCVQTGERRNVRANAGRYFNVKKCERRGAVAGSRNCRQALSDGTQRGLRVRTSDVAPLAMRSANVRSKPWTKRDTSNGVLIPMPSAQCL